MKPLCKLLIMLAALAGNHLAWAAHELSGDVPAELVKLLFNRGYGPEVKIYDGVMDGFPAIALPKTAGVIGGVDYGTTRTVFVRVASDVGAVKQSIEDELGAHEWEKMPPTPQPYTTRTGFQPNESTLPVADTFCSDTLGSLSLSANPKMPDILLLNYVPKNADLPGCGLARGRTATSMASGLGNYVPRMELSAEFINQGMSLRQSGSFTTGNSYDLNARLEGAKSIDRLFASFNRQIGQQDWTQVSRHKDKYQATSSWIRKEDDDTRILGTLTIVTKQGLHALRFHLESLGADSANAGLLRTFSN